MLPSCFAITSYSKIVAFDFTNNNIKLWNFQDRKLEGLLIGHEEPVNTLAVTSNEEYLISGACDLTFRVWSLLTWDQICVLRHSSSVISAPITRNNSYIVFRSFDNAISILNPIYNPQQFTREGHDAQGLRMIQTSNNTHKNSNLKDSSGCSYTAQGCKQEINLQYHSRGITSVRVTKSKKYILVCYENRVIQTRREFARLG